MTSIPLSSLQDLIALQEKKTGPLHAVKRRIEHYAQIIVGFAVGALALLVAVVVLGNWLMPVLLVVFALGGMGVAHEQHTAEAAGRPRGRKWLPTSARMAAWTLCYLIGVLAAWQEHWLPAWALCLILLAHFCLLAWWLPDAPPPAEPTWHSSCSTFVDASISAGILKVTKGPSGETLRPVVLDPGLVETTPEHLSKKYVLPSGSHWEDYRDKRKYLASAIGVDDERLMVSHDRGDSANVVRISILTERPRRTESLRSPYAHTERCDWRQPTRLGENPKTGAPVLVPNQDESGALSAGLPASGKTSMLRIKAAPFILDPTTTIYGLDGKGSREDYNPLVPLTEDWIWGDDEDAVEHLEQMLDTVLGIVKDRNRRSDSKPTGGWPGLLLLLEELQEVRAAAKPDARERIDSLLGRIGRMGRAASAKIEISTQRPSALDLPTGVRNVLVQNVCLMTRSPADAKLALGITPTLALPTDRGEAIYVSAKHEVAVDLDFLSLPDFRDLCRRGLALRGHVVTLTKPTPTAVRTFAQTVYELLDEHRELTPLELLERLPDDLRPANIAHLGRRVNAECLRVRKSERASDRKQIYRFRAPGEKPRLPSVRTQSAPGSRSQPSPTGLPPGSPS